MANHAVDTTVPCPECGLDPGQLSPPDAAVAARSLARRWRSLLCAVAEREDDGQALLGRRLAGGWSALDHATHVAEVFDRTAEHLDRVWTQHQPGLDEVGSDAPPTGASASPLDEVVDRLASVAEVLARRIDAFQGDAWNRVGFRAGSPVTALQLAREAIHQGHHRLRLAGHELAQVCVHPLEDDDQA